MVRRWVWVLGLLALGVASGWTQTYGPGEIYYGGIRLQLSGRLVTAGTCMLATQPAPGVTEIRCQLTEGSAGTIELTATRTPAGAVNMRVEAVPAGWPGSLWTQQMGQWVDSRNAVASAWGTVTAQYRFTAPAGSAGRQFTLRFKAWTVGVVGELELRVILDVVQPPTTPTPTEPTVPPSYGPFTGTTDGAGRFDVPIPTLPNTTVTGHLTECTVRPLPRTQVSVTLVPKPGVTAISRVDQIGAVRVSSPGYGEVEITQLQLASSMDMFGRVSTTVGVGTVCLRPAALPVTPPPPTYGPITGTTDAEGRFTGTLAPGVTVAGRLTECTVKPLPNQMFTLTPLPKGEVIASPEDIAGFTFNVPGYAPTTISQFSKLSLLGLTWYDTGPVCLFAVKCPEIGLRILTQNAKRLTHGDPTLPAREQGIFDLLRGPVEHNFDIVCLQEWFQDAGPWGAVGLEAWSTQKEALLRHWLGAGANPDLTERSVENTTVGGIQIIDASSIGGACEIIVGTNYVAGPDAAWFLETLIDGGLVILVRPGLVISRASAFVFSDSQGWDSWASKGALYARVQLDPESPECFVHVFNTHLQAGDTPGDAAIRLRQISELIRFIDLCTQDDRVAGKAQHPVIVCGDFNIIGGSPEWQNVLQNMAFAGGRLEDVWLKLGKAEDKDAATWVGNDQDATGTPWGPRNALATEPGPFQRLDYILFYAGEEPLTLTAESVSREPEEQRAERYQWGSFTVSDHLGVKATFKVVPK